MKPINIINKINESYEYGTMTNDQFELICDKLNINPADELGGIIRFNNVSIDVIKDLANEDLINLDDKQNEAPSVGEMIELSEKDGISNVTVDGYVVVPRRDDSRISVDGLNFDYDNSLSNEVHKILKYASEDKIEANHAEGWWD